MNPFNVHGSSHLAGHFPESTVCGVCIVAALLTVPSALPKYFCEELETLRPIMYW